MKKKIIIAVAILAAIAVVGGAALFIIGRNKSAENKAEPLTMLNDDVSVDVLIPYTGKYVEDGSDAETENVAAVRITNNGETNYQYIEFTVTTDKATYSFTASSIHAGTTHTVLEKNKMTMTANEKVAGSELTLNSCYFEEPSLHEDTVGIYESHGVLNIQNKSEKDIKNAVVYYKQTDENGFLGGITYRTTLDSIKAGETKQFNSEHFDKVVNITYEQ